MGKSPFLRYVNATLLVVVAVEGELSFDENGNALPASQVIEYKACLKSKFNKDDSKLREQAGVDSSSIYLEGWVVGRVGEDGEVVVGTAFLPVSVPCELEAVVDSQQGRLQVLPTVSSPFGVEQKTGQKIMAYFSHRKGG
ncbi:hypothetical protein JYQ62_22105 [Nostoc sp. UHCC 0702]|nr:hypothetical protein JYQ62_22105 [Nostoc sp. UHCC 0702]